MEKEREFLSCYDPRDANYIFKDRPRNNKKKYSFFGYNGNYPYLFTNAIKARGNWKILDYDEQVQAVAKQANKRAAFGTNTDDPDKISYVRVDEAIIDKCHFIWRPA